MGRVGHPHLRLKAPFRQAQGGGRGPEGRVEMAGEGERKTHGVIEELRLALSKNDFGVPGARWPRYVTAKKNLHLFVIIGSTFSAKLFASSGFAPQAGVNPFTYCEHTIHEKTSHPDAPLYQAVVHLAD